MMGRQPLPPKERKSESIRIRVSKAELARLNRAAHAADEDLSTWARNLLLAATKGE